MPGAGRAQAAAMLTDASDLIQQVRKRTRASHQAPVASVNGP